MSEANENRPAVGDPLVPKLRSVRPVRAAFSLGFLSRVLLIRHEYCGQNLVTIHQVLNKCGPVIPSPKRRTFLHEKLNKLQDLDALISRSPEATDLLLSQEGWWKDFSRQRRSSLRDRPYGKEITEWMQVSLEFHNLSSSLVKVESPFCGWFEAGCRLGACVRNPPTGLQLDDAVRLQGSLRALPRGFRDAYPWLQNFCDRHPLYFLTGKEDFDPEHFPEGYRSFFCDLYQEILAAIGDLPSRTSKSPIRKVQDKEELRVTRFLPVFAAGEEGGAEPDRQQQSTVWTKGRMGIVRKVSIPRTSGYVQPGGTKMKMGIVREGPSGNRPANYGKPPRSGVKGKTPEEPPPRKVKTRSSKRVFEKFPSPSGLKWSEVQLAVVSDTSLKIMAHGITKTFLFSVIGFTDGRKRDLPDSLWHLLLEIARYQGRITPNVLNGAAKTPGARVTAVSRLRKRLSAILGLGEDPFEPYQEAKGYRAKFQIEDKRGGG